MFTIAAFYHFFDFPDYAQKRSPLLAFLKERGIKGSILVASEGINGTISGTRASIDETLLYIEKEIVGGPFEHKESAAEFQPFGRAKVRLKKETISLGVKIPSPARGGGSGRGAYVEPKDWNALITAPDTIVLDARNDYEVHLGTFQNAVNPRIKNFKQLPDFVNAHLLAEKKRKIATFCTGGIRCEKFAGWLLDQGFEHVYQLKGGILKYLEETPPAASRWQGECYVFDERVAVGHGLAASATASMCKACGHALTEKDRANASYKENESCPYCT